MMMIGDERIEDGDRAREEVHPIPPVRDAHDAGDHAALKDDPSHEDAKADIALDESFPTSDAPGHSAPGSNDPAPSSGYDEDAERRIIERRERAYAIWEQEGRPDGRHLDHWEQAEPPEPGTAPWTEGP
jgi:hypothetical protein